MGAAPKHKCHHKTKGPGEMTKRKVPGVISGDKNCVKQVIRGELKKSRLAFELIALVLEQL